MNIESLPSCKLVDNLDSDEGTDIDIPIIDLNNIKQHLKVFKETGCIHKSTEFLNFLHFIGADNVNEHKLINLVKIHGNGTSVKHIIGSNYFISNVPEGFESWLKFEKEDVLKQGLLFRKEEFPDIESLDWVEYGNLHIYKHIGVSDDIRNKICRYSAKGGNLYVLKWLRSNGCPCDEETCSAAARGGHLEVLKWAHNNGCPWNENTCSYSF